MLTIGIDGGGTGSRAALERDGQIVALVEGGPANVTSNPDGSIRNVLQLLEALENETGVPLDSVVGHIGLAGVMNDEDAAWIASRLPLKRVAVSDDRPTMVMGALAGQDGCVAAIGTGSFIAFKEGLEYRFAGGWGLSVSDQASGAWLGRELLVRTLLCFDGLEDYSPLTRATMAQFADKGDAIVSFCTLATPKDYAELAPMVVEHAQQNDPHGLKLMQDGARYISQACKAVGFQPGNDLCLAGGLGPSYAPFLQEATLVSPQRSALDGALMLARAMA